LHDRSDHIWEISLDAPTSDNPDDNEVVDTDTNAENKLDNILSPYNVTQLQSSCTDGCVFLDYFYYRKLFTDDAGARKVVYQSEKFVFKMVYCDI